MLGLEEVVGKLVRVEGGFGIKTFNGVFRISSKISENWGFEEDGLICTFLSANGEFIEDSLGLTGLKDPLTEEIALYILKAN